jgi:hypothetical protein
MPMATMAWENSFHRAALQRRAHAAGRGFQLVDAGVGVDGHALLGQRLVNEGGDVGILDGRMRSSISTMVTSSPMSE